MVQYRRPRDARDKPHHCTYPNCNKAFYVRHSLLRHQTDKHGRAAMRRAGSFWQQQEPHLQESHLQEPHLPELTLQEPHLQDPHLQEPYLQEPHLQKPTPDVNQPTLD
ncbi:hypothetical protein LSAT2_010150 [Lamellibrachia satsuma]|nr:hypothetical protein LSAT2_010150 [Lamellibrachia satsuma]